MNPSSTGLRQLEQHEIGFDYRKSVLELNRVWSYEQIAGFCGYKSRGSIGDIASGTAIPGHPQGEALYILYFETFGRKPTAFVRQTEQLTST